MVGYRPDSHGEDALALARLFASARLVREILIVQVLDGAGSAEDERRVASLAKGWPSEVSVSARTLRGESVAESLHAAAEEERADALVLGATHRGLAGRILRGTTAGHLSPEASWPLLVAPEGFRDAKGTLRKIGVAYDASDESQSALDLAVGLASRVAAGLRLIAVVEPPPAPVETWAGSVPAEAWADGLAAVEAANALDAVREQKRRDLAAARASIGPTAVETQTIVGDAVHELREAARDLDLLVVGSHGRGRVDSLLMGSVSRGLVDSCPAPLAVVPGRQRQSSRSTTA